MSDQIRRHIYDFITANLTDDALERIRLLLMVAPAKHKIPVNIKIGFAVDDMGEAKFTIGMDTHHKIPEWDSPLNITSQLSLWAETAEVNEDPLRRIVAEPEHPAIAREPTERPMTPIESSSPPQLNGPTIPDEELSAPAMKLGMPGAAEPPSPAATRLAAIKASNEATLQKAERDGSELSAGAKKALKEMSEKT